MSGFGAFASGLFEGAQFGVNLLKARNELEISNRQIAAADAALAAGNASGNAPKPTVTATPVADPTTGTTPTSTTTAPQVEMPPEAKPGLTPDPKANADKVAPYVSKRESSDRPYVGYSHPNDTPQARYDARDLSKAPALEGYFGFPDWRGNVNLDTGEVSRAAGLYQFEPETWKKYAQIAGVNDFSPESQKKVFDAAYAAEGTRPWNKNRTLMADLGQAGLLGGASPQVAAAVVGQPTAPALAGTADTPRSALSPAAGIGRSPVSPLAGTPGSSPGGTGAPDLEGQRAKAQQARLNAAKTALGAFGGGASSPTTPAAAESALASAPVPVIAPPQAAPVRVAAAPAADAAASSMGSTPAASVAAPAPVTMPQSSRPMLASLRQDPGIGGGIRPPQSALGGGPSKVFRMPNGQLVDGIGNIVRPSPLYPRSELS